jgi:hypothetical protein
MGHVVVFPQEAKRLEEELERCRRSKNSVIFPRIDHVHEFISVAFIGTRAQWEAFVRRHKKFFARGLENLQVRVDVVYFWLKALKVLNPYYRDLKIDESPERMKALEELPSQLMSNATIFSDEKEIFIAKIIQKAGSNQEIHSKTDWCCNSEETESAMSSSSVTRATRPNSEGSGASTSTFHGNFVCFCNNALPFMNF